MNKISILSIIIVLAGLFACSPVKKIETTQSTANSIFESGNYTEALKLYEQLMTLYKQKGTDVPSNVIENAGISAFKSKAYDKAKEYLTAAFGENKTINILMMLIDTYRNIGDVAGLKKLITDNIGFLKNNNKGNEAYTELFKLNYNAGKYDEAYSNYQNIKTPGIELFADYLEVLNELGKKDEAEKACKEVLASYPDNVPALEYLAKSEYNKAESWYKSEMAKYNKNKNATTYAYLRRDLKKISTIFRSARDKFEKLHSIDPENKTYIKYLKNCYLRLDMKDKAAQMEKLLK
jgi:tetratricopeptide (TPR) repeat protein